MGTHTLAGTDAADVAETAGRVGLVARGVIYVVIALLAVQLAAGGSGAGDERVDQRGALSEVADHAFGTVLLVLLAAGFGCYALWRAVRAWKGEEAGDEPKPHKRLADVGRALLHLSLMATTVGILGGGAGGESGGGAGGESGGGEGGGQTREWTVRLLDEGWGRWAVGAAGLVLLGGGVWLVQRGRNEDFRKHLERFSPAVVRLGKIGHVGRGIAFGFIGAFVIRAAWRFDPEEPIGLDAALRDLATSGWGRVVVLAVAVGLAAFGLFSMAEARDRRVLAG